MSFSFTETKASTAREFYAQGAVAHDGLSALKIEGRAFHLRAGGFANPFSCRVITSVTFNNIYFSFQAICFYHKVLLYVLVELQCLDISGILLESALIGLFKNCLVGGGSLLKPIRTLIYFPSCCQCQDLLRRAVPCFYA